MDPIKPNKEGSYGYDIKEISQNTTEAWLVVGDFNAVLYMHDRLGGDELQENEVNEYAECMDYYELTKMRSFENYYSWTNIG